MSLTGHRRVLLIRARKGWAISPIVPTGSGLGRWLALNTKTRGLSTVALGNSDNVYGLELTNGSRVLALPGSDDSIRGLTVTAGSWPMKPRDCPLP
jgi:hypothetical protein